jgi:hypothetical protein
MSESASFVARYAPGRGEGAARKPPHLDHGDRQMSAFERLVSTSGHNIHKLKAKDTTGRWAIYYVYVPPVREKAFQRAISSNGVTELEEFGRVVGSCYGEAPTEDLRAHMWERFRLKV